MGRDKHLDSNERCIIHREGLWGHEKSEIYCTIATSLVYPLRTSSLPRSIPDMPSDGSGLERFCSWYLR